MIPALKNDVHTECVMESPELWLLVELLPFSWKGNSHGQFRWEGQQLSGTHLNKTGLRGTGIGSTKQAVLHIRLLFVCLEVQENFLSADSLKGQLNPLGQLH